MVSLDLEGLKFDGSESKPIEAEEAHAGRNLYSMGQVDTKASHSYNSGPTAAVDEPFRVHWPQAVCANQDSL